MLSVMLSHSVAQLQFTVGRWNKEYLYTEVEIDAAAAAAADDDDDDDDGYLVQQKLLSVLHG